MIEYNEWTYLVGPIERAADAGKPWRRALHQKLESHGIGVIDSTVFDEHRIVYGDTEMLFPAALEFARHTHNWDFLRLLGDEMWGYNAQSVDKADFLVAHFSSRDLMGGTTRELQRAYDMISRSRAI